ncbi:cytochrome P450 3A9 [Parasteatoda tepidariorum]|uniref:cytochrome P450 3A9 n=1 Tax=Parasteatoda tepidariorum TaxID=114398 RepID=UPI0039BD0307
MEILESLLNAYVSSAVLGVILLYILYRFSVRNHNVWKEKNVPFVKPYPFVGSLLPTLRYGFEVLDFENLKKSGRIYGYYDGNNPALMIAEPELLRDIYVKDFQSFLDHTDFGTGEELLEKMLIIVGGEDWKRIRMVVSPTFSTGKLKKVLGIFEDCSKTLIKSFKKFADSNKSCDVYKMYGSFTVDIIASSAFSTKIESRNDPNNIFVKHVKRMFEQNPSFRQILAFAAPNLARKLGVKIVPQDSLNFFRDTIYEIIKQRRETGQTRNDFLQLLLECANEIPKEDLNELMSEEVTQNYGSESADRTYFKNISSKSLSMDEIVAQCILFFIAGYQTTTLLLGYTTYNLAVNQKIQDKVFEEIKEQLRETNGKVTYEAIQNRKYLDNVISEALRLHPPVVRLDRIAVVDYKLKGTEITIPKGTTVTTPVYAMHRDPEFFPDPETFDPDRFSPENKDKIIPYSYLPFGSGPRNCIGMRFALLETKICLTYVLSTFQVLTGPETKIPLEHLAGGLGFLRPKDITLRFKQRDDCPLK